jgi:hypothetical protein
MQTFELVGDADEWGYQPPCIPITNDSPQAFRETLLKIAGFMQQETKMFGVTPYSETLVEEPNCVGYLLYDDLESGHRCTGLERYLVMGAACFRFRENGVWGLQWAWVYPSYRGQGLAKTQTVFDRAWPVFEANHPGFLVEGPYSGAMKGFLNKSPERQAHIHPRHAHIAR